MKKILICITVAWAIFFPNLFYAHDVEPSYGFKVTQQENTVACYQLGSENFFLDIFFEDISDDDSDESERKKVSSATTFYTNTCFVTQIFFDDTAQKNLSPKFFFPSKPSLLIFLCVFRI